MVSAGLSRMLLLRFDGQYKLDQPVPPFDVATRHVETHGRHVYAPHHAPFSASYFYEAYNLISGQFSLPLVHISVSRLHAE